MQLAQFCAVGLVRLDMGDSTQESLSLLRVSEHSASSSDAWELCDCEVSIDHRNSTSRVIYQKLLSIYSERKCTARHPDALGFSFG